MALPTKDQAFDLKSLDFESKIKAKPDKKPQFTTLFSKGGMGKSTIASYSPDPIIIPVGRETGHERMCVPKFPTYSEMNLTPIEHVFACMQWVLRSEHTRKTLIIDNVGSYRESVDEDVETSNPGIDLKAYGKGAAFSYPYWTRLLAGIDAIMKKRDMHVILLGHDGVYNVNLPDGSYYQKISINAPRGENTNVFYLKGEDMVIADKRGIVSKDGPTKKYATTGNTKRIIYAKPRGEAFAKSRPGMNDYYEIENSESEEELLQKRSNESIIQFWNDVYK
jgi:hypothetical protein